MNVGNKAASLLEMQKLGMPVPDFFIISTEFFKIYKNGTKGQLPEEVNNLIATNLDTSYSGTWAVRSSSTKEDSQNYSFAGLFESHLGLQSLKDIKNAIIQCWESTDSERVKNYAEKKGVRFEEIEMAVVIQKFIEPDWAGVLFTAHPLTAQDQEMYLEVCQGRGEKLVSGHITPDQIRIRWQAPLQILEHQKNEKVDVNHQVLQKLLEIGQQLQAHYGCPQDIEFAVQNSEVFVVQSRPITKLQFSNNEEEWTTADFRDGGVSADVVSPLTWSLYEKIFSSSLPSYFQKIKLLPPSLAQNTTWFKVFYARPYWNLKAVKDIMSQVPEFNEKNFDQDMSIPITYEGSGRITPFTLMGLIKVFPTVFALSSEFKRQMKRSQELTAEFHKLENFYRSLDWKSLSNLELTTHFKKLVDEDYTFIESEYFQTIYNASNAKMEFMSSLKTLQKIDPTLEYVKLISDLGELEALQPAFELLKIANKHRSTAKKNENFSPELQADLKIFIHRFYYHSERELDLLIPRWCEDTGFILKTLTQLFQSEIKNPEFSTKAHNHQSELLRLKEAYLNSSARWIPGFWNGTLSKLERVRNFLKLREEIRGHSSKMYFFIRQACLEIAKRKLPATQAQLIFYAPHENIQKLLEGSLSQNLFLQDAVQLQRYALGFRHYKNPNEIGYRYNFIGRLMIPSTDAANRLKGIGCSAGIIRAKARVVLNITEASQLQAGEILVTRFTDPGWTPLFSLASGVVCENGGLLSHAALISREYGIPSVLNINNATVLIRNGQEIELDGLKGEVTLL